MSVLYLLLSLMIITSSSHGAPSATITPCKADDKNCMLLAAKTVFAKFLLGDRAIGLEPLEPMHLEEVNGTQTILKYKMTDVTITGFSACELKDLELDSTQQNFVLKLTCPRIVIEGNYEMDGRLIVSPVEGKGKFSLDIDVYDLVFSATYKIVKSEDGKEYFSIKSYQSEGEPKKGVMFDFQNLFNGNTKMADSVHKFANENWKSLTLQFQGPITTGITKKLVKTANKILKAMPMERVFL